METKDKTILAGLAKKEAEKLKKMATKSERGKLSFEDLSPSSRSKCIYGQMTGDCFSARANRLIKQCAGRVYKNAVMTPELAILNGKPMLTVSGDRLHSFFSPIECFITFSENIDNGNNKALLDYLKGKKKSLSLKKI